MNKTTLDQWCCLLAFAAAGAYAGAGALLHKTPTSVFQSMSRRGGTGGQHPPHHS